MHEVACGRNRFSGLGVFDDEFLYIVLQPELAVSFVANVVLTTIATRRDDSPIHAGVDPASIGQGLNANVCRPYGRARANFLVIFGLVRSRVDRSEEHTSELQS